MIKKFKSLSMTKKVVVSTVGVFTLLGIVGAASPQTPKTEKQVSVQSSASVKSDSDTQDAQLQSKIDVKTVEETTDVPFQSSTQNDATIASGQTVIAVAGVNGKKVTTFEATYTDGAETSRKQLSEKVTLLPVNEVKKLGTKVAVQVPAPANCDPNYSGACVPIASDVDCAGGSGNGPAYVHGPVTVIGTDIYKLDADHDGIGCE